MITLIVNKGKCKCMSCTMTKYGADYYCNRCGKPEFDITDDNFMDTPDVDLINDLRAELDEEARLENEEEKEAEKEREEDEWGSSWPDR